MKLVPLIGMAAFGFAIHWALTAVADADAIDDAQRLEAVNVSAWKCESERLQLREQVVVLLQFIRSEMPR